MKPAISRSRVMVIAVIALCLGGVRISVATSSTLNPESAEPPPQPQALRLNPFMPPTFIADFNRKDDAASADVSGQGLELRAVLLSDKAPMVNVNGKIIGLGEEIDGYALKSVEDDRVVFEKRDREVILEFSANGRQ